MSLFKKTKTDQTDQTEYYRLLEVTERCHSLTNIESTLMKNNLPVAIPIKTLNGANGPIYLNNRVKTFYAKMGQWCHGIITEIHPNNICNIIYDEGFSVVGDAIIVFSIENNNIVRVQPVINPSDLN